MKTIKLFFTVFSVACALSVNAHAALTSLPLCPEPEEIRLANTCKTKSGSGTPCYSCPNLRANQQDTGSTHAQQALALANLEGLQAGVLITPHNFAKHLKAIKKFLKKIGKAEDAVNTFNDAFNILGDEYKRTCCYLKVKHNNACILLDASGAPTQHRETCTQWVQCPGGRVLETNEEFNEDPAEGYPGWLPGECSRANSGASCGVE